MIPKSYNWSPPMTIHSSPAAWTSPYTCGMYTMANLSSPSSTYPVRSVTNRTFNTCSPIHDTVWPCLGEFPSRSIALTSTTASWSPAPPVIESGSTPASMRTLHSPVPSCARTPSKAHWSRWQCYHSTGCSCWVPTRALLTCCVRRFLEEI